MSDAMRFPTNLCAWTDDEELYPEYVSVNAEGKRVDITVRGPARESHPGVTATVSLSRAEFQALILQAQTEMTRMITRGAL